MVGEWNINIRTTTTPEELFPYVIDQLKEFFSPKEKYEFVAYLGFQIVHGVNHAVLTKYIFQNHENMAILIFNELDKKICLEKNYLIFQNIDNIQINPTIKIPQNVSKLWDKTFEGFIGAKIIPIMFLGVQKDPEEYIFLAEAHKEENNEAILIAINTSTKRSIFVNIFEEIVNPFAED